MSLIEFRVVARDGSGPRSGPNLVPLVDATKDQAKATRESTTAANMRHTDTRQISAEEEYGLVNNWQDVFRSVGVWDLETMQSKGTKINDGKHNYILLDRYIPAYGDRQHSTNNYLAHVSASDPYLKEVFLKNGRAQLHGSDMLEDISIYDFKENRMPAFSFGWKRYEPDQSQ